MPGRIEAHKLLLQPTRARVYHALRPTSAVGLTELARSLGQTNSSVMWHLKKLEDGGLVAREAGPEPARFRRAKSEDAALAEASRILQSVPARELMLHLARHPGQHLGQAALSLYAPRSRYWRVVKQLEGAGLVRVTMRVKARLLYPTPLAHAALRTTTPREWAGLKAQRTRRRRKPHDAPEPR